MSFESAMCAHLKAEVAIAAIVGTDVYKTICDNPDAGVARIVCVMDGGQGHVKHMGGVVDKTHRRGQLFCRESTIALAEVLASLVEKAINAVVRGTLGAAGDTAEVSRLSALAPSDEYVPPSSGKDQGYPTRTISFEAWVHEAV